MEPINVKIEDTLDLHTFNPREISDLLDDYFSECRKATIFSIRIIHGKGTGKLKRQVHHILKNHKAVTSFSGAPPEAGGWGATIVELKR